MTKTTKSTLFFALIALAAVLALSACGSKNNDSSASSSPSASADASADASAPAAAGETQEVTVNATNFQFEPQEIKAKVGDTIKLTLKNESGTHGLAIPDLGVKIKNGETAEIVLDKAGTYEFNCSIMCGAGHDNMTGQLIVE